ncbi:MAG: hypothetical protein WKF34_00685 [Pyrinomonadaceae bacterium]
MYRRPKFLEALIEIRREMAEAAGHNVEAYAEMIRLGHPPPTRPSPPADHNLDTRVDEMGRERLVGLRRR